MSNETIDKEDLCYSHNEEDFMDIDMAIDYVLDNCQTIEEAREAVIYAGEKVRPKVNTDRLAQKIYEDISERLYDEVGEYAENFIFNDVASKELEVFLKTWEEKLDYHCYSVKNVRSEPITNHVTEQELIEYFKD